MTDGSWMTESVRDTWTVLERVLTKHQGQGLSETGEGTRVQSPTWTADPALTLPQE